MFSLVRLSLVAAIWLSFALSGQQAYAQNFLVEGYTCPLSDNGGCRAREKFSASARAHFSGLRHLCEGIFNEAQKEENYRNLSAVFINNCLDMPGNNSLGDPRDVNCWRRELLNGSILGNICQRTELASRQSDIPSAHRMICELLEDVNQYFSNDLEQVGAACRSELSLETEDQVCLTVEEFDELTRRAEGGDSDEEDEEDEEDDDESDDSTETDEPCPDLPGGVCRIYTPPPARPIAPCSGPNSFCPSKPVPPTPRANPCQGVPTHMRGLVPGCGPTSASRRGSGTPSSTLFRAGTASRQRLSTPSTSNRYRAPSYTQSAPRRATLYSR